MVIISIIEIDKDFYFENIIIALVIRDIIINNYLFQLNIIQYCFSFLNQTQICFA